MMIKKIKKAAVAVLAVGMLAGAMPVFAQQGGGHDLDIQSRQLDPGGSCTQITTGNGCFRSSIVNHTVMASHSNTRHTHNVTAANILSSSQSPWRAPSASGQANASINATGHGNTTWWNVQ